MPLIEAFYKRVPVLAYAATAVPATMDGGGVLYDTTDPLEIARLMEAVLDDPRIEEAVLAVAGRRARPAAGAGLRRHAAALRRADARRARRGRAGGRVGLLGSSSSSSSGSRSCASSGRRCIGRCRRPGSGSGARAEARGRRPRCRPRSDPSPSRRAAEPEPDDDHQPVGAGGARGDAIGDSARRVRDLLRGAGSRVRHLRADDRRRPARRRAAVRRSRRARAATSRSFTSRCRRR